MPTVTGKASSFVNFSRPGASGGGATVVDADGRIKWAGHNLLTNSESFDAAAWSKPNVNISANQVAAPNGTSTADLSYPKTSGSLREVFQSITYLAGASYTLGLYVKAAGLSWITFGTDSAASGKCVWFDVSTGTKGTEGTSYTGTITPISGGWYYITVSFVGGVNTLNFADIQLVDGNNSTSVTANGTNGVYLWGAHLYRSDLGGMQANPAMPANMGSYYPTTPRNLLGYTEDFSNAAWTLEGIRAFGSGSLANAVIAPNGLQTADLLVESTAAGLHRLYAMFSVVSGTPYVWSAYVKPAGRAIVQLVNQATSTVFTSEYSLSGAGSASTVTGSGTAAITALSDGWYRISAIATATGSGTGYWLLRLCSSAGTSSYTGDGVSGIYLWGAQLSDSASLGTYVPQYGAAVTSAAYYAPRLDFDPVTLAARGLLVEEQRTNSVTYSDAFDNASWGPKDAIVSANAATAPDGTSTADKIIPNSGAQTLSGANKLLVASAISTLSVYAKAAEFTWIALETGNRDLTWFNLGTGAVGTTSTNHTASITSVGSGWYRCIITTKTVWNNAVQIWVTNGDNTQAATGSGTNGVFLWGAQVESGASFATSYIPTGSATATRTADVASVSTQAFPYSQDTGSLVFNFGAMNFSGSLAGSAPYDTAIGIVTDGSRFGRQFSASNISGWLVRNRTGTPNMMSSAISGSSALAPTNGAAAAHKLAIAISTTDMAGVVNGGIVSSEAITSAPTGTANLLYINPLMNGHIRQITYLPRRISNADLIARTA